MFLWKVFVTIRFYDEMMMMRWNYMFSLDVNDPFINFVFSFVFFSGKFRAFNDQRRFAVVSSGINRIRKLLESMPDVIKASFEH